MFVIPVIDLMGGIVVRGVAGRRDEYRPVVSRLAIQPSPGAVAAAFARQFGFDTAYVADLDAIQGGEPDWTAYRDIAAQGLSLWVDGGIGNAEDARQLAGSLPELDPNSRLIVGLESLAAIDDLSKILASVSPQSVLFSLDLKAGRPLTQIDSWRDAEAEQIVSDVVAIGLRRLIVLDLADVGVGGGTRTLELLRRLKTDHADLEIVAGGGVRGVADLRQLADAGCDAALVASALHDGVLSPEDVRPFQPES